MAESSDGGVRNGWAGHIMAALSGKAPEILAENLGMNCPTCSTSVPDDAAFCPQCGGRLKGTAAAKLPAVEAPAVAATMPARAAAAGLKRGAGEVAENELWTGGYSPKAMYGGWIAAALATIAGLIAVILLPSQGPIRWWIFGVGTLVIWGGLLVTLAYRRMSVKYRLTNQRLFHEQGILRRVTERIELIDIDDVTMEQGLMERLFGVGTVHVTSSDRSSPELLMPGIDDVKAVADTIDHAHVQSDSGAGSLSNRFDERRSGGLQPPGNRGANTERPQCRSVGQVAVATPCAIPERHGGRSPTDRRRATIRRRVHHRATLRARATSAPSCSCRPFLLSPGAAPRAQSRRWRELGMFIALRYLVTVRRATVRPCLASSLDQLVVAEAGAACLRRR